MCSLYVCKRVYCVLIARVQLINNINDQGQRSALGLGPRVRVRA